MKTLSLDLEGTLISNAVSQTPRDGLLEFLENCGELVGINNIVIYTTVSESKFREIAELLHSENIVPKWFLEIRYIQWNGNKKDLSFVDKRRPGNVLLIDDHEGYVCDDQKSSWVRAEQFAHPYDFDDGLREVFKRIEWLLV